MAQARNEKKVQYNRVVSQPNTQKMSAPGLLNIYKVWESYCGDGAYHYIFLEFQTAAQASEFQKNELSIQQKDEKIVFKIIKDPSVSAEGCIFLRSEFEISNNANHFYVSKRGNKMLAEKVLSQFEKQVSIEGVAQKYCIYDSISSIGTICAPATKQPHYEIVTEAEFFKRRESYSSGCVSANCGSW